MQTKTFNPEMETRTMETIDILESLQDAIQTLNISAYKLAGGSFTIWRLVDHAKGHLDAQIKELLAPPPEHECTVDLEIDLCTGCGVEHSESCPGCSGRGYHAADCTRCIEDWARN